MIPINLPVGDVPLPPQMGFGITDTDAQQLFRHLPKLSAYSGIKESYGDSKLFEQEVARTMEREREKATTFAKVVDLKNANADGISYENKRRIILAFSKPENPFDPGRTEVQGT